MTATVFPLQGYPFALDVQIDYHLDEAGLTVTTTATNVGDHACPYGCGQHPYLSPGGGLIDECILHLEADTRILTDPDRQLPTGTEPVQGTRYDFRTPRIIGDLRVDYAFTDLARDHAGAGLGRTHRTRRHHRPTMGRPHLPHHRDLHRGHAESRPATSRIGHRTHDLPAECLRHR